MCGEDVPVFFRLDGERENPLPKSRGCGVECGIVVQSAVTCRSSKLLEIRITVFVWDICQWCYMSATSCFFKCGAVCMHSTNGCDAAGTLHNWAYPIVIAVQHSQ